MHSWIIESCQQIPKFENQHRAPYIDQYRNLVYWTMNNEQVYWCDRHEPSILPINNLKWINFAMKRHAQKYAYVDDLVTHHGTQVDCTLGTLHNNSYFETNQINSPPKTICHLIKLWFYNVSRTLNAVYWINYYYNHHYQIRTAHYTQINNHH